MAVFSRSCQATLARLQSLGTPAATVTLLRDAPSGLECLLLRKSKNIRFGGLWVFPGGKVDAADHSSAGVLPTAADAAVRETHEECGAIIEQDNLLFVSHWLPPTSEVGKRGKGFSTFFFVAPLPAGAADVSVDGSEIESFTWLRPSDALERHASGRLGLLPPTWMTLDMLKSAAQRSSDGSVDGVMAVLRQEPALAYETRSGDDGNGRTSYMWEGDAGWPTADPSVPGPRLRLTSTPTAGEEVGSLASGAATLILDRTVSCQSRL